MQLEFGFMEELRQKELKESMARRHLPYFEDPQDDNQRLLNYQHDWLEKQDEKAWENLWALAQKVARRMVSSLARKHGFRFTGDDIDDRVNIAVEYVLRRYQDGWWVRKAYLKALKEGVVHALWYRTMSDENEITTPDEILALYHLPEPDEDHLVMVEGMTREEAEARVRAEFLPEIADGLLKKIKIIGGCNEKKGCNQSAADQGERRCPEQE